MSSTRLHRGLRAWSFNGVETLLPWGPNSWNGGPSAVLDGGNVSRSNHGSADLSEFQVFKLASRSKILCGRGRAIQGLLDAVIRPAAQTPLHLPEAYRHQALRRVDHSIIEAV